MELPWGKSIKNIKKARKDSFDIFVHVPRPSGTLGGEQGKTVFWLNFATKPVFQGSLKIMIIGPSCSTHLSSKNNVVSCKRKEVLKVRTSYKLQIVYNVRSL